MADQSTPAEERAFAFSLIADIAERLGDIDQAFHNHTQSRRTLGVLYAPRFASPGQRTARDVVEGLRNFFSDNAYKPSASPSGYEPALKTHVFFVGFFRSGTTLLEQSLAIHPDIETLDETGRLMRTTRSVWTSHEGLAAFADADERTLAGFRTAYWNRVHEVKPQLEGKILVDKMPLNCLIMPLAQRLFPDAKFLFAIRDPRDVVFSCFRTRIAMTEFVYEFCDLTRGAEFYDSVMSLCELYRRSLSSPIFDTRYEDLVADFEGQLQAICRFLGTTATVAMAEPAARVRVRGASTPSSAQIARGLYNGSQQWRPYARHLAEILPTLEPWVRRLGYSVD